MDRNATPKDNLIRIFLTCAALVYIQAYDILPMQDFPDWLYQANAFSQMLKGHGIEGYYLKLYPVPNSISTIVIGLFGLIFNPETAGKLFFGLYVIGFTWGSVYLIRALSPKSGGYLPMVPFLFVFSHPFFHGNVNYLFGLAVLFIALGYMIRRIRANRPPNMIACIAISVILFFSHAVVLGAWLIFLGLVLLDRKDREFLRPALIGATPAVFMLLVYALVRLASGMDGGAADEFALGKFLAYKIKSSRDYFFPFHYFYPFFTGKILFYYIMSGLNLAFFAMVFWGALVRFLIGFRSKIQERYLLWTAWAFMGIVIFTPKSFAGMVDPGQRFIYPALFLLMVIAHKYSDENIFPNAHRVIRTLVLIFLLLQIVYLHIYTGAVSGRLETVFRGLNKVPFAGQVYYIDERHFDYQGAYERAVKKPKFMPQHSPLDRIAALAAMEKGVNISTFPTGMMGNKVVYPSLKNKAALEKAKRLPEQIIITGPNAGVALIESMLPDEYTLIWRDAFVGVWTNVPELLKMEESPLDSTLDQEGDKVNWGLLSPF